MYTIKSTTLFIVRHGQTDWDVIGKIQGHIDIPLNGEGIKQAAQVASFLSKKKEWCEILFFVSDMCDVFRRRDSYDNI